MDQSQGTAPESQGTAPTTKTYFERLLEEARYYSENAPRHRWHNNGEPHSSYEKRSYDELPKTNQNRRGF